MKTLLATMLLVPAALAGDSGRDFDALVGRLESTLQVRRIKVPLMGLVGFAAGIARPAGVKGFKFAVFERVDLERIPPLLALDLGAGWRPVVRVRNRHTHTAIYARDEGSWTRLSVLTLDGGDAALVQFELRPTRLLTYVTERARTPN